MLSMFNVQLKFSQASQDTMSTVDSVDVQLNDNNHAILLLCNIHTVGTFTMRMYIVNANWSGIEKRMKNVFDIRIQLHPPEALVLFDSIITSYAYI